jgi:hypothetical protein
MTTKKNNLMKLAKGKKETTVKAPAVKKEEVKVPEKVLTPEEERDLKTKAKVEELLDGVEMTLKTEEEKKEEILEIAPEPDSKDVNWLEEQVSKLSKENERLKSEATLAKNDYSRIFEAFQEQKNGVTLTTSNSDGQLQAKVVELFNEIQAQYLSLGNNLIIYPAAFLNRLIKFFPFLDEHRRF